MCETSRAPAAGDYAALSPAPAGELTYPDGGIMRIHTNTLTRGDIRAAADRAGVGLYRLEQRGSRSRALAWDVILEGHGRTGGQWGNTGTNGAGDYVAATWDEWGMFLAEVFRRDPAATIPRVYDTAEHFRWVTVGRYDTLAPSGQHARHRWEYLGPVVTGAYAVRTCRKCGAHLRQLAYGRTWEDIAGGAA